MAIPGFFAVAWNNGAYHTTGAGYGVKLSAVDRDSHIRRKLPALAQVTRGAFSWAVFRHAGLAPFASEILRADGAGLGFGSAREVAEV